MTPAPLHLTFSLSGRRRRYGIDLLGPTDPLIPYLPATGTTDNVTSLASDTAQLRPNSSLTLSAMFPRKYQLVKLEDYDEEEEMKIAGNLPEVQSSGLFEDKNERENPVYFSSLSASILQERRERTKLENEEKRRQIADNTKVHQRRRHNAEVQTPGRVENTNPEDLMEALSSLVSSLSLSNEVEMRTLLENQDGINDGEEKDKKKTRKRTALSLYKVSQAASQASYAKVKAKIFFFH